jgi:GT2 family glycosyltransferase
MRNMNTNKFDIIATVVTFNNPIKMLDELQVSFFDTDLKVKLIFIDNSSSKEIKQFSLEKNIEYIGGHGNIGFGPGHNIGINKYADSAKYFLILNPDVIIEKDCLKKLASFMDQHEEVPLCTPLILNPDRSIQFVNKRLPTVVTLFARRFFKKTLEKKFQKELDLFTLQDQLPFNEPIVVPVITGCFMFFRSHMLKKLGGFDPVYFMYMEEFDLSRRSSRLGPNVFYPQASIIHAWGRGAHNNFKLLWINIQSIYSYFVKWGFRVDEKDSIVRKFF